MRIGLDFDNTIVSYDILFHKIACEKNVVPPDTPVNKIAVRNYLRNNQQENIWTEIQGEAYGARIKEAKTYKGVINFLIWAKNVGHDLAIISHKSQFPFQGPQYDLHTAAREWIDLNLIVDDVQLIPAAQVFFEPSQIEKLARIGSFGCEIFLDDLPEILQANGFPASTRRILFDPEMHHDLALLTDITLIKSWDEFGHCLTS
jgi:hypothetical protein